MILQGSPMFFLWLIVLSTNCAINSIHAGENDARKHFSQQAQQHKKNVSKEFFSGSSSLLGRYCHAEGTDLCHGLTTICFDEKHKNVAKELIGEIANQAKIPENIKKAESEKFLNECFPTKSK